MAINIPAIAARAAAIAQAQAASVLTSVTIRTGPTESIDTASDQTTTTWANETALNALEYAVKLEEVDGTSTEEINAVITGRAKKLLVWDSDLPTIPTEQSTVLINGAVWQVKGVAPEPSGSIFVLQIRR